MTLPQLHAKAKKLAASYELPFDYEVEVTANLNDTETEFYCKLYPNREQYTGPLTWAGDKAKTEAESSQEFAAMLDEKASSLA
jgi:hypothetical protein